jgi:hypothetical protein
MFNGRTVELPRAHEIAKLMAKCHNGYLSTVIGLCLIIIAALIVLAAMMLGVMPAAISSLIFLGWAIPAMAQGIGKWRSAQSEMRAMLEARSELSDEAGSRKKLSPAGLKTSSRGFAVSVTEATTANLDQRP